MAQADLDGLAPHEVAVLLVDFQNDFCHPDVAEGRAPPNTANALTALRANEFARQAAALGVQVIYSQQILNLSRLTPLQRQWELEVWATQATPHHASLRGMSIGAPRP